jgi:membrane fusion protein (multidrug efflux system)
MRLAICAAASMFVGVVPTSAQQPAPTAVPVSTVLAEKKPITRTMEFVGRVEAISRVEIKARVQGYLEAVEFTDGALVKEGAPLYRIEKGLFQAAVEQAQGNLEVAKAAKILSTVQLQRAQDLFARQVGTAVARDQALAEDGRANGQIMTNQAALDTAKINLGYTEITSPIAGKIARTKLTKGNVVGPDSGALTTIASQDPMYVTFPVSQREFLRAQEEDHKVDVRGIKARLRFADGRIYDQIGSIDFVDVSVDRATDTILARAVFANPASSLVDGQLVRVNLEGGTPQEKVLIPQAALLADQGGTYVFVVVDGTAVVKRVTLGGRDGTDAIVESGLSGGEQVIVDGLQGVRPGAPVRASPMPESISRS